MSGHLAAGGENAQSNGEIEASTIFWQVSGRQIQGDTFTGKLESRVEDGAAYAILALLDGRFR